MAFTDHKITGFQKKLADLPDEPNLSAAELKGYFDSSPEELRTVHNALCEDAARLDTRVSGIVTETFGDTIPKSMLAAELQSEIDAKAEEATVAARLAAEQTARETTDAALTETLAQKCEVYFGTYTGDGESERFIDLGFTPKAVLVMAEDGATYYARNSTYCHGGLALPGHPVQSGVDDPILTVTEGGFLVYRRGLAYTNSNTHHFIAFR